MLGSKRCPKGEVRVEDAKSENEECLMAGESELYEILDISKVRVRVGRQMCSDSVEYSGSLNRQWSCGSDISS